jgi:hypothetical protein
MSESDKVFAGSIPENYDRYLVPLIFEKSLVGTFETYRLTQIMSVHWGRPELIVGSSERCD